MMEHLNTPDLIDLVRSDATASERELMLLDRLLSALDEIDVLTRELGQAQTEP